MLPIFNRDHLIRFRAEMHQQGLGSALAKSGAWLGRAVAGRGRSALPHVPFLRRFARTPRPSPSYLAGFWREAAVQGAFHVTRAPARTGGARRIAMIGDLNLPQCRKYRVEQLGEFWGRQGVDFIHSHVLDIPRATAILQDATHLMFYRTRNEPLSSMYLYEARRLRLPVLYDLDDPLFSVSAYETYSNMTALPPAMRAHFVEEAPRYLDAMNLADIVTVSTPGLRDHAALHTARPVHFRRNFADADTLAAAKLALKSRQFDPDGPFRVAFASGSQGHEVDFSLIADDIATFLAGDGARQLVILGHFDAKLLPEALRARIETHPFTGYDAYLRHLASVDCAVMPLCDDAFNRCKSAVRVIDAAAVAVPALVSGVGDLPVMVEDGRTGRVMGPGADWAGALEDLARDRAGCRTMGQAARAALLADWTGQARLPIVEQDVLDWVLA